MAVLGNPVQLEAAAPKSSSPFMFTQGPLPAMREAALWVESDKKATNKPFNPAFWAACRHLASAPKTPPRLPV